MGKKKKQQDQHLKAAQKAAEHAVKFARSKSTTEKLAAAARGMQQIIGGFTFSAREMEQAFAKLGRLIRRVQHSAEVDYVLYGPLPARRSRGIKTGGLRERLEQALSKRRNDALLLRRRIADLERDNRHLRCLLAPLGLAEAPLEEA